MRLRRVGLDGRRGAVRAKHVREVGARLQRRLGGIVGRARVLVAASWYAYPAVLALAAVKAQGRPSLWTAFWAVDHCTALESCCEAMRRVVRTCRIDRWHRCDGV